MRRLTRDGEVLPAQVGAARFLLGWSQADLARAAGLARSTVIAFENATRPAFPSVREVLRRTLEGAGVEFVFAKDGSYGVVLVNGRRQEPSRPERPPRQGALG